MVSCFVTMVVAATLGQQVPDEAAWIKAIPADVDVVARMRPLAKGQADLIAMVKAMSPTYGGQAGPVLTAGEPMLAGKFGPEAASSPMMGVVKLPKPGEPTAWAVLIKSNDYAATLKAVAHKPDATLKSLGGYDSFEAGDGQTYFAVKGAGFVALGLDEGLIKAMVKPESTLDSRLTGELKEKFFAGDLGIFVNVSGIESRFGEQIDQMKAAGLAGVEQAGAMMNNKMGDSLKSMVEGLFDAIKAGDSLALNFDFAAEGLTVGGVATTKPKTAVSRQGSPKLGGGDLLGSLPDGATIYTYVNLNPDTMASFQKLGMSFMTGGGKPSPELAKALDQQRDISGTESYTSTSTGGVPTTLNVTAPSDPQKAVETSTAVLKAIASPDGFIKSVVIDPNTQAYKGYTFHHATTTMDLEKMITPNVPGGVDAIKKQLGGTDKTQSWYGTNGKLVLSVAAKDWDEAKAQVDAFTDGTNALASTAGYKALRAKLPKQASALVLISAQGIVKQMAGQMAMVTGADPKVPADMPKEAALMGMAVVSQPNGFSFTFILPSDNGPVFEKGLVPLFQGLQGGVKQ